MPLFLITKKITTYLTVDCADETQARAWNDRIVAALEAEGGFPIPDTMVDDFVAECNPDETTVALLED